MSYSYAGTAECGFHWLNMWDTRCIVSTRSESPAVEYKDQ